MLNRHKLPFIIYYTIWHCNRVLDIMVDLIIKFTSHLQNMYCMRKVRFSLYYSVHSFILYFFFLKIHINRRFCFCLIVSVIFQDLVKHLYWTL